MTLDIKATTPEFEVTVDRVATGGSTLGLAPDGRVVFVDGGVPGDVLNVEVTAEHRRRLEAKVLSVVAPSNDRVEPTCAHRRQGCGGCDWQHVAPSAQISLRADIVADCLRRLGGFANASDLVKPAHPVPLALNQYRTTVRAAIVDGRAGMRMAGSHEMVKIPDCETAHPLVRQLLDDGRFGTAQEVTVRVGARTGERLVIVSPDSSSVEVPEGVIVVGVDELDDQVPGSDESTFFHEVVGGHKFRISARSFFQCRPDGAELLAATVKRMVDDCEPTPGGVFLDAYSGVGLFGALAAGDRPVVAVESSKWSVADARINLGSDAKVIKASLERWRPEPATVVVADPARAGLGKQAASRLVATGCEVLVLVSCDPASLARDAKILDGHGYELVEVALVDMFGQTSHIEAVSRFQPRR